MGEKQVGHTCVLTKAPTSAPTSAPTHTCDGTSHGCNRNKGGICIKGEGNNNWMCGCKAGYMCTAGCKEKRIGHKCESREILSKRKAKAHKTKEKEKKEKAAAIESKEKKEKVAERAEKE